MGLKHHPRIVTSGLFLYFDAANLRSYTGSGITINNLFSGYGGTLVNGPTFSSSNQGYFSFDGTNDYAQFTLPALTNWSFSFWIYNHTVATSEKQLLSTFSDPTGLSMISSYYNIWNGFSNLSTSSIAQSSWTNVVFTNNGFSNSAIYVNGILDASFNTGNQIYAGAAQLLAINGTLRNTQAYLGSFLGYNKTLTASEVFQNFIATKKRYGR